jgi:hypothetical protein
LDTVPLLTDEAGEFLSDEVQEQLKHLIENRETRKYAQRYIDTKTDVERKKIIDAAMALHPIQLS